MALFSSAGLESITFVFSSPQYGHFMRVRLSPPPNGVSHHCPPARKRSRTHQEHHKTGRRTTQCHISGNTKHPSVTPRCVTVRGCRHAACGHPSTVTRAAAQRRRQTSAPAKFSGTDSRRAGPCSRRYPATCAASSATRPPDAARSGSSRCWARARRRCESRAG